jgi:hypothetical protein
MHSRKTGFHLSSNRPPSGKIEFGQKPTFGAIAACLGLLALNCGVTSHKTVLEPTPNYSQCDFAQFLSTILIFGD